MRAYTWMSALLFPLYWAIPIPTLAASEPLETFVVEAREMSDIRWFDGIVEAVNSSTVSAQTSGRIVRLDFDVDDFVQAGEVIVEFSDVEHQARLEQAIASLEAAAATRKGAQDEFKRMKELLSTGVVSRANYDNAKATYDAAQAHEGTASAAVDQAREQMQHTVVRAPYSGLVKARHVELGELASQGQPLLTGFSLEQLRVSASVPQQFALIIRRTNRARVVDDSGNAIESDQLTVFPYADEQSNTVTVRADLPEATKSFFPGMLVKTGFSLGSTHMLMVPESSIVRRGEVTGVYLIDANGQPRLQQIRTGRINNDGVEIVSGLRTGDQIALDASKATQQMHARSDTPNE